MSCIHAETTTLLWLYGEADEAHASHVAECDECGLIAAMHADVAVASQDLSAPDPTELPAPANGASWTWISAIAVAAAVSFALLSGTPTTPVDTGTRLASIPIEVPLDDLALEFDVLDAELDDLSSDFANL